MSRRCDLDKQGDAFKPKAKNSVETNTHGDVVDVEIERLQLESPSSPPSSSAKMDPPIRASGNVRPNPRIQKEKPPSPTHSYLSTRTDASMDRPVKFKEGFACEPRSFYRIQVAGAGSPASMVSDCSKEEPLNFKGVFSPDESMACDFCTRKRRRAVKSCLNCTASYCEMHLQQHYTVPALQRHKLVEATGNLEHRLCPQHHRALELFCNTDQMPICSLCLTPAHRGHDVVCSEPGTQNDSNTKRVDEWIVQHHSTQASAGVPPPPGEIAFPTVASDSVSLSWGSPEGMDTQSLRFRVTYISDTKQRSFNVTGLNHINIQSLSPGKEYTFSVAVIGDNGTQSQSVSATVSTVIPAPVGLTVDSVTLTSFSLRWSEPHGLDQTPSFLVSNCSPRTEPQFIFTELHSNVLSDLQPGRQYTVSVCAVLENGEQSEAVSRTLYTEPSPPESLSVEEVRSRSLRLCWDTPTDMEGVSYTFSITYTWDGEEPRELTAESKSNTADLCDLKPGMEYSFSICTVLHNGIKSTACSAQAHTQPSAPGELNISSLCETSLCLSWDRPTDMEGVPHTFRVTWGESTGQRESITTDENPTVLSHLRPGTEYSISVCTVMQSTGLESESVHTTISTKPSAPGELNISSLCETSLCLSWDRPTDMESIPYTFRVTRLDSRRKITTDLTDENLTVLSYLRPGTKYSISVCTVMQSTGLESEPAHTTICTKPSPPESLNICYVSEMSVCLSWDRPPYMEGVPYTFKVTWGEFREQRESITTDENFTVLSRLRPGTEYSISVCTELQSSLESEPVHTTICTNPSPPERLRVEEMRSKSVRLCWDTPTDMEGVSYAFSITYTCDGEEPKERIAGFNSNTADLWDLKPGMEYSFSICTVLHNGIRSRVCSARAHTRSVALGISFMRDAFARPPRRSFMLVKKVNTLFVSTTSACLSWDRPTDMDRVPHTFRVTWGDSRGQSESITTNENFRVLSHLTPGTEYSVTVCNVLQSSGLERRPAHTTIHTKPPPPRRLRVKKVRSRSVRLCWNTPTNMEGVSYTFSITYTCDGEKPRELTAESNSNAADLCDLKPGMEYSFSICTVLHNDNRSTACSARARTQKKRMKK